MCGLVGVISTESTGSSNRRDWFFESLLASQLRGRDGTGVYGLIYPTVYQGGSGRALKDTRFFSYKKGLSSADFIQLETMKQIYYSMDKIPMLIGHTRSKTRADIADENAHPFVFFGDWGKVAQVHNGHITNASQLPGIKKQDNFSVDSEYLCKSISMVGPKTALEAAEGSFSIIMFNRSTNTLYMASNGERPLFFGFIKKENTMLVASEDGMLEWIAARNDLEMDDINFLQIKEDKKNKDKKTTRLLAFDIHDLKAYGNHKETTEIELKFYRTVHSYPGLGMNGGDWEGDDSGAWNTRHGHTRQNPVIAGTKIMRDEYVEFIPLHWAEGYTTFHGQHQRAVKEGELIGVTYVHELKRWMHVCAYLAPYDAIKSFIIAEYPGIRDRKVCALNTNEVMYGKVSHCNAVTTYVAAKPITHEMIGLDSNNLKDALNVPWEQVQWECYTTPENRQKNIIPFVDPKKDKSVLYVMGPREQLISDVEYAFMTQDGCAMCQAGFTLADAPDITWEPCDVGGYAPICTNCALLMAAQL